MEVSLKKKPHSRKVFSMSEESFGDYNDRAELELTQTDYLQGKEKGLVKSYMKNSILFQNLDDKDE